MCVCVCVSYLNKKGETVLVYSGSEMVVNSSPCNYTVQLYSINVYSSPVQVHACLLLHYATTPIAVILYQGRESARSKIIPAAKSPHETSVAFEWLTGHPISKEWASIARMAQNNPISKEWAPWPKNSAHQKFGTPKIVDGIMNM